MRSYLYLLAVATLSVAAGCGDLSQPAPVDSTEPLVAGISTRQEVERVRGLAQLHGVAPIAKLHEEAMREAVTNIAQWTSGTGSKRERICEGVTRLTEGYVRRLDLEFGVSRSGQERRELARSSVRIHPMCDETRSGSVFRTSPSVVFRTPPSVRADFIATVTDTATGDFRPYVEAITSAVNATGGYESQVSSAVAAVVSSASGLNSADYAIVVMFADLANSSATTWNNQDWGPSGDYCLDEGSEPHPSCGEPIPESVFLARGWIRKALVALGSDVLGGGAVAGVNWWKVLAGAPGQAVFTVEVGAAFIATSAITALGFLATE